MFCIINEPVYNAMRYCELARHYTHNHINCGTPYSRKIWQGIKFCGELNLAVWRTDPPAAKLAIHSVLVGVVSGLYQLLLVICACAEGGSNVSL